MREAAIEEVQREAAVIRKELEKQLAAAHTDARELAAHAQAAREAEDDSAKAGHEEVSRAWAKVQEVREAARREGLHFREAPAAFFVIGTDTNVPGESARDSMMPVISSSSPQITTTRVLSFVDP